MTTPARKDHVVVLSGADPIARGAVRDVWDRPGHPGQVLKTIRAAKREKHQGRMPWWSRTFGGRFGPYATLWIEYACYLKTAQACALAHRAIPIAEIGGLVVTDHGLAQVAEKITGPDGGLAPTFQGVAAKGPLADRQIAWLNDFVDTLFILNVNAPDLTIANVVLDERRERFVLIDGFGDKTLVPARAWIKPMNQAQLDRRCATFAMPGVLNWDPERRQFSAANAL